MYNSTFWKCYFQVQLCVVYPLRNTSKIYQPPIPDTFKLHMRCLCIEWELKTTCTEVNFKLTRACGQFYDIQEKLLVVLRPVKNLAFGQVKLSTNHFQVIEQMSHNMCIPHITFRGAGTAQWPGFDSRTWCHIWVKFVVGSRLCSERFFSGYFGSPLSSKTNSNSIWNPRTTDCQS